MITDKQKKELDKIKPRGYRELVQNQLKEDGYEFSVETIAKVFNQTRENEIIENTIVKVFQREHRKKQRINKKRNLKLGIAS